jgi:hypothetical protein
MNNFKVLEKLDFETNLMIIDENQIEIDDRYFSYYRGKYDLKKILEIIKSTVFQKILDKEFSYKDSNLIDNINDKLICVFNNLELFSTNESFDDEEKTIIVETIKDLILFNKEIDKKINNLSNNTKLLRNESLNNIYTKNSNDNSENNPDRFCYYKSLSNLIETLKKYCIIGKNKTLQGLRYAKIKFIQYAGNIQLRFL